MYNRLLAGSAFQIIRIADARGLCEGYNRGIAQSRGEILVFSHDDLSILCENFRQRLLGHLEHCDLLGVAGTTHLCDGNWLQSGPPYIYGQVIHCKADTKEFEVSLFGAPCRRIDAMQGLDGVFLCCKREVAEKIGFDQETFTGFHLYDLDFSFRAYRAGYKAAVCTDLDLFHESLGKHDANWLADVKRFRLKHGSVLTRLPANRFVHCAAIVPTLQAALPLLRPPHWKD